MLADVLKWIWKTFSSPSIAKISGGISCKSDPLWFATNCGHVYPVTSIAAGVKKVTSGVADGSVINALKLYLYSVQELKEVLFSFL